MPKRLFPTLFLSLLVTFILFFNPKFLHSQEFANDPNAIGPELPVAEAGANVVDAQGFTGVVAVINNPDFGGPVNTVPSKSNVPTILRLWVEKADAENPSLLLNYAHQLNLVGASTFPNGVGGPGGPVYVVVGVELNNLQWWGAIDGDLRTEGENYGRMFIQFSKAIADHRKFPVSPGGPDLYNADYSPLPWIEGFRSTGACDYADVLTASVFDVSSAYAGIMGVDRLDTWKYLETHMCPGKKVVHFEGWGTDPSADVKEQVRFYNETPLPPGIPTATTLIAPNCGGQQAPRDAQGNYNWWYYVRGKVYTASGKEVDIENCTLSDYCGTGPSANPFNPSAFKCDLYDPNIGGDFKGKLDIDFAASNQENSDPEYHSLRPYPRCPYTADVRDATYYSCANTLNAIETIKVFHPSDPENPGGIGSFPFAISLDSEKPCVESPDGSYTSYTCGYLVTNRPMPVTTDFSKTELPVLGLTRTPYIINAQNQWGQSKLTNELEPAQKMTNYVSWYLNGTLNRAEESLATYQETYPKREDWMTDVDYQNSLKLSGRVINYSGPINKLYPRHLQNALALTQIKNTNDPEYANIADDYSISDYQTNRHNQAVACTFNFDGGLLSEITTELVLSVFGVLDWLVPDLDWIPDGKGIQNIMNEFPGPCYPQADQWADRRMSVDIPTWPDTGIDISRKRLSSWVDEGDHTPPNSKNYDKFSEYWRAFENWRGKYCPYIGISGIGLYFCYETPLGAYDGRVDYWSNFQRYIPKASTEDMTGYLEASTVLQEQPVMHVAQSKVSFVPKGESCDGSYLNMYYPHVEETTQMGLQLQKTYLPSGESGFENKQQRTLYDVGWCEEKKKVAGPGDWLREGKNEYLKVPEEADDYDVTYPLPAFSVTNFDSSGTYTRENGKIVGDRQIAADYGDAFTIEGELTYSGNFTCQFTRDTACMLTCTPGTDCDRCWNFCEVSAGASASIYNAMPRTEEIMERFVDGSMSIFKRIFPRFGSKTPVVDIKDLPAVSYAEYQAGRSEETDNVVLVSAGDPSNPAGGTARAEVYFPHLGSVKKYFLEKIQVALRPRGFKSGKFDGQDLVDNCTPSKAKYFPSQAIPPMNNSSSCVNVYSNPVDAQRFASELRTVLTYQQTSFLTSIAEGWSHYYAGTFGDWGLNYTNPTDQKFQNLFHTCCGKTCYEYVIDRTLAESYLNPYLAITIALNENGGLLTTDPDKKNAEHFGCDRYGRVGYENDIGDKLTCMLNTFNAWVEDFSNITQKAGHGVLQSYGYRPEGKPVDPDKTYGGVYSPNLNSIIQLLSENKYGGMCRAH